VCLKAQACSRDQVFHEFGCDRLGVTKLLLQLAQALLVVHID
jgi:hypothetical protein